MTTRVKGMLAVLLLAGAVGASGCVVRGQAGATVAAPAPAAQVSVVSVSPGVWVVEDYHQPVFYSNNVYWMYDGGMWYRTSVWGGGWTAVTVGAVPVTVRRIDRPRRYVRYRASSSARRRYVNARRDNRSYRRDTRRDARRDRRDARRDRRDTRREVRRERRDDRRETRRDNRDRRRDKRDNRRRRD